MLLVRASGVALVCTVLAAGAHLTAGGRASASVVIAVFFGTLLAAAGLAKRHLTTGQLLGLLLLGQVVVHLVCAPAHGASSDAMMVGAHVAGTALSAWLLRHGEDALWTLAERLGLRPGEVTSLVAVAPRRPAGAPVVPVRARRRVLLSHVIEGRGPPAGLA